MSAIPYLYRPEFAAATVKRNVSNLINQLWDPCAQGFDDRPGVRSRVPNKLATMTIALIELAKLSGESFFLPYAKSALDDLLSYQVASGVNQGAVHQYAPECMGGDGRFFPYYNARCIPGLVAGACAFSEPKYHQAAVDVLRFLKRTMNPDGSWPQIIYANGTRAEWPRWLAGTADILLGFHVLGSRAPEVAIDRLLSSQLPSGGFATAEGFAFRPEVRRTIRALRAPVAPPKPRSTSPPTNSYIPDFRDLTPVVGWNDKVLRLLSNLLEDGSVLPAPSTSNTETAVSVSRSAMTYFESPKSMTITSPSGLQAFSWNKGDAWASASNTIATR
jgi:hypothetical protein